MMSGNPFDPDDESAYRDWRERKLEAAVRSVDSLLVEVADPLRLTAAEREALLVRCARANMAVYASPRIDADSGLPRRLGAQLGLHTLEANYLADDDGITALSAATGGTRADYIPYTNRALRWHTDGYYNPPQRAIRAMLLHCVRPAASGGENRLLDHELAYIALRDLDPAHIRALMRLDAMTIPARSEEGVIARADSVGPVFAIDGDRRLRMRYTARTRSIAWNRDPRVHAAAAALAQVLEQSPFVLQLRLQAGMGLVCNNVLHDRAAFVDTAQQQRLVLRARYYEPIADTGEPTS